MTDDSEDVREQPRIIALWSAPRSRSTAFLRMMMQRDDLVVLHEPFSILAGFGEFEIAGRTVRTASELIEKMRELSREKPVFFKDTTDFHYPEVLADERFLREGAHTFVIRDPAEVIASHYALNPDLDRADVGFARLHELYTAVEKAQGAPPVVVDSDDLLDHPEATVRSYCARIGLIFRADALTWQSGVPSEWRKTERWHVDASESTGFVRREKQYTDTVESNAHLAEIHAEQLPFYSYLFERRIAVEA
ncbi:hypothetical protein ADL01_19765 [Streptomyces sp. NRRL WC-3618]|uniref:sulfotransferase-like domain-containing protein n=1 Tax=Streptomyces sp. NRRL WC-3618 TaxID=1519490 RepID=UPI0006AFE48A|nr:sulfotransferase family protein [Streptomyces sp. NRRL WC-3618]KOV71753.1 hypothetical protein ADL01_19765 [Streptomyces sp. NRRL WC-3618]